MSYLKIHCLLILIGFCLHQETALAAIDTNGVNPIWMAGGGNSGNSLKFSRDGAYLASDSGAIWRRSDGALVRSFRSSLLSSDGSEIAGRSEIRSNVFAVRVWSRADGAILRNLTGESNSTRLALSPDDTTLAAAGGVPVGSIRMRRFSDGTLLRTLTGHTGLLTSLVFSDDSSLLVSASMDKTVRLWRVSDGALLRTMNHSTAVFLATISPDNVYIASETQDATLKIWNAASGILRTNYSLDTYGMAFSPTQPTLAAGSSDTTIRLYNTMDWSLASTWTGHTSTVKALGFAPDGKTLASVGDGQDAAIRLWDMESQQQVGSLGEHTDPIFSLAIAPDGLVVASGCGATLEFDNLGSTDDPIIRLWDGLNGRLLHRLQGHTGGVLALDISTNSILASAAGDSTARLWNIRSGELLHTLSRHTTNVWAVAFSKDGSNLFSGGEEGAIYMWRVSDGTYMRTLAGHTDQVRALAASPDGLLLASASFDHTVRLWRISDGEFIRAISVGLNHLLTVVFSPNGALLATSGNSGTANIYRVSDGALIHTFNGISSGYLPLAFSPSSDVLAAGVFEHDDSVSYIPVDALRMWRVSDWMPLGDYRQETTGIAFAAHALAFSADGYAIAYGRSDGTVVMGRSPFGGLPKFTTAKRGAGTLELRWQGGAGQYQLQSRTNLSQGAWQNVGASTSVQSNTVSVTNQNSFFRVRSGVP
jgi:WD40 repeat protein